MTDHLTSILDLASAESFGPAWLQRNGKAALPPILGGAASCNNRNPRWRPDERAFLAGNIGLMNDEQIAEALGRTENAIKIKRQRWALPAHSKRPGWLTGNRAAKLLKVDIHNIVALVDRGLLPASRIPGKRGIIAVREQVLFRWAVNPANWVYFDPSRVTHPRLRRLVELKRQRWPDEWWTVGDIERHYHATASGVLRLITLGKLPAVRWGNWRVLRSDALQHPIRAGKGHGHELDWSPAADDFILLADAVGLTARAIGRLSNLGERRIPYRLKTLVKGDLDILIHGRLPIDYDPARNLLFTELRHVAHRFPSLVRTLRRCRDNQTLSRSDLLTVRAYLAHLMDWYDLPGPRMISVDRWTQPTIHDRLVRMLDALRSAGIDPFEGV